MFEISRSATVTAEVWDMANRHVATVFKSQRRAQGEHLLVWDGRDSEGRVASSGAYEVEVSASTMFTTASSSTRLSIEEASSRPAWEQVDRRRRETHYERFER